MPPSRAGITITYSYGAADQKQFVLRRETCLICDTDELAVGAREGLTPLIAESVEFTAISRKTGRAGSGEDQATAYADLIFNLVDAMRFFALEANGRIELLEQQPLLWHRHSIWKGPGGKGGARAYRRLTTVFSETYEAKALEMAAERIQSDLNIQVGEAALKPNPLEATSQMLTLEPTGP